MQPKRVSCGIITERLLDCREFYCQLFGFTVVSETQWYIQLRSGDGTYDIGLLAPAQVSQPPILQPIYNGRGCWINVEVDDVDACYREVIDYSIPIDLALRDEPWGERHFMIRDPAGMVINVMSKSKKEKVDYLP